jgi:hypothetical protein
MGGCCRGCRPRPAAYDVFPLLLILAVVLTLICLPRLIFRELIVFERPRLLRLNWGLIAAPLVLLAIVHWLSSTTSSCGSRPVPPCKRCHYYSCKGCLPWGWLFFCYFSSYLLIMEEAFCTGSEFARQG